MLLFALAKPDDARAFFAEKWPDAAVVCELTGAFHRDLLGARRMRIWDLLRPGLWRRFAQARRKGHRQGPAQADVWRLGGAMLVRGANVLWRFQARDAADHPDLHAVPRGTDK